MIPLKGTGSGCLPGSRFLAALAESPEPGEGQLPRESRGLGAQLGGRVPASAQAGMAIARQAVPTQLDSYTSSHITQKLKIKKNLLKHFSQIHICSCLVFPTSFRLLQQPCLVEGAGRAPGADANLPNEVKSSRFGFDAQGVELAS